MMEHTGPIVLEGEWVPAREVFHVVFTIERESFSQEFTVGALQNLIRGVVSGFQVGGRALQYHAHDKRDIGPRARRGFKSFFENLLTSRC